jgi:enoyl-CoA hydratase/carnithine racemase
MLTGKRFGAAKALAYGLVSEVAPAGQLDAQLAATVADILKCAPNTLRECKRLLFAVLTQPDSLEERVTTFERLRMSEEAAEGILAFIQKRSAPWAPDA